MQFEVGGGFSSSTGVEYRTFSYETDRDKLRVYSSFFERQDAYYNKLATSKSSNQTLRLGEEENGGTTNPSTERDDSVSLPQAYNQTYEDTYDDSSFVGTVGVNPWIDFSLKNLFWMSLGGEAYVDIRDFDFDTSATLLGIYGVVGKRFFKDEISRIYLKYKFNTILAGGSMEVFDHEVSLIYEQVFLKSLGLNIYTIGDIYMYAYDDTPGPSGVFRAGADLSYTFPVGLKVGGVAVFDYISEYILASSSKELVKLDIYTDGTDFGGKLYISFKPAYFPWISASLSQSYNMYYWSTDDNKEAIEKSVPSSSDTLHLAINVNLFF